MNVNIGDVVEQVSAHFTDNIINHKIPEQLWRRFEWLSAGDVAIKQQLLNHMRSQDRLILAEAAHLPLPVMIAHMQSNDVSTTSHLSQTLKTGNHGLKSLLIVSGMGS